MFPLPVVLFWILGLVGSLSIGQADQPPAATCREWRECQRMALEAYASHDYERFHDLAWLTVRKGPARDPELMFLLARAQSLSGRPHDALVMLGRLTDMGLKTDAATSEDFEAVRRLRQWQELEPAAPPTAGAAAPSAPTPAAPEPGPEPPPKPDVPVASVSASRQAQEALRIPGTVLGSAGLAYDRVSSRFIVTDSRLRDLMIIDERSRHLVVLLTAASAGFFEITGLEIDPSRGDLWVVSAESAAAGDNHAPASALHKVQLVSGRPLERIVVPEELQPCHFADVAVTADGSVLVLDSVGKRLLRYRSSTRAFTPVASLELESPTSIAAAGDRTVYVAHATGIARVDAVTGAVKSLPSARTVELAGFERIRSARNALVGVQRLSDGGQRVARVTIVNGRATAIDVIDGSLSATDRPAATMSGDEFYFMVHEPAGAAADVVIRRSRLR